MSVRISTAIIAAAFVVSAAGASLVGQARPAAAPSPEAAPSADRVKAFIAARTAKSFVAPKTPWGDPDIQGNFTTKEEANTPFERPEKWAGRKIEDITPEELAADIIERQQRAVEQAPFAGGGEPEEGVAIAVPIHWFDNLASQNARPWFVIDPTNGMIPPTTGKAQAAATPLPRDVRLRGGRRDSYTDRSLGDRCIGFGLWRLPAIYGNSYQLLQTPDHVVMRYEMIHEARVIPLNDRTPVGSGFNRYMGDSRGHFEGNTLVVETTNINPSVAFRFGGGASAKNQRVIERFTRISPKQVEWTVTIDDPTTYVRPWTYSMPMTQDDQQIIYEYACHEGNYGLANLLSAGRTEEKSGSGEKR
jgi:hypothetical protein